MLFISEIWKIRNSLIALLIITQFTLSCGQEEPKSARSVQKTHAADSIKIIKKIWFTDAQLKMTKAYCKKHYGIERITLKKPKMIVVHYTAVPSLEETLQIFQKDSLSTNRKYIANFSALNVGVHYIVDKDGTIYQTKPDTIIARHIIGFNHVALGIENVALNEQDITSAQLKSNVELIRYLLQKKPGINYLIGHHEYNNKELPHYKLIKIKDPSYAPYKKPDPGNKFMSKLRKKLAQNHGIKLKK